MNNQGKCVWYDLFSTNIKASASFYTQLFGWTIEEWKIEGPDPYLMFKAGEKLIGGITQAPIPQAEKKWLAYVNVPNLKDSLQKINSQGGKILFEKSVPNVGAWVIAQDPEGCLFAPFQAEQTEEQATNQPPYGLFCWHELLCKNPDQSFNFYSSLFNWKKGQALPHEDNDPKKGLYQIYHRESENEMGMGGIMQICEGMPENTPSQWVEYIFVKNIEETLEKAKSLGATPTFPIMPIVNGGKIAGLLDPQKTSFALVQSAQ